MRRQFRTPPGASRAEGTATFHQDIGQANWPKLKGKPAVEVCYQTVNVVKKCSKGERAVVRTEVLSRLDGYHIDVIRVHGRVLVVAAEAKSDALRLIMFRLEGGDRRVPWFERSDELVGVAVKIVTCAGSNAESSSATALATTGMVLGSYQRSGSGHQAIAATSGRSSLCGSVWPQGT
jgi:hypothetical protein